jgi:hypothetical protein
MARRRANGPKCWLSITLALGLAMPAVAHKPSDSYLRVDLAGADILGRWDIALRDLEFALGLDDDLDGRLRWREVEAKHAPIAALALSRLAIRADGHACPIRVTGHRLVTHSDGTYAVLDLAGACARAPAEVSIDYSLFFDIDRQHKGLLRLVHDGRVWTGIFADDARSLRFDVSAAPRLRQFADFLGSGVYHIWSGYDHLLFVVCLLLPAVLVRRDGHWHAAPHLAPVLWQLFGTITAFTVAHSVTLALATFGVLAISTRVTESVIAASVGVAALNNLKPVIGDRIWMVAFGFGLIHGFGFAAVLADLGLPRGARALSLAAFNIGVEVGQLAIVMVVVPIAYLLRHTSLYRRGVLTGGSMLIATIAGVWFLQRALGLRSSLL